MDFIFLNAAGTVQFSRNDIEQGNWTQEEYTADMVFPFNPDKIILRGMRVAFRDPATGTLEMFEVRNVTNVEPDHSQKITCENIAVAELSDEHINNDEFTNKTAAQVLTTVLTGTLWSVGNNTDSGSSSGDIGRGNVWQAVNAIMSNWNVYITPRIVFSSAGSITGRYLDISPAQGTWRGVRLAVEKNMTDASVIYDDSEVFTALYGYGGMIEVENQSGFNTSTELNFKNVVWSATSSHPAKPSGQEYLEWPEKTALYGRNGRPRFGYYQNADITDDDLLLEKTWEMLKTTSEPKINISGTVTDLYRLGYHDEPLRLHDTVIVEVRETGEKFEKDIIKLDVDLLDPTNNRAEIGNYIPNIIYINRDTNEVATTGSTGSRGGGGGGRGQKNSSKYEYDTWERLFEHTDELGSYISMVVGKYNGNEYIKAGEIGLAINHTGDPGNPYETKAYINADHVNISATTTNYSLAGEMERDANGKLIIKSAGGMYVQRTESGVTAQYGVFDNGNLTAGVVATIVNGVPSTYISGDKIYIGNETATTVINGKCALSDVTAQYIQARIEDLTYLAVNRLSVKAGGSVSWAGNGASITDSIAYDLIKNLKIELSGNTYTLSKVTVGDASWTAVGSFSRAVSSWSVGGGNGKVNVTANPQSQTKSVNISVSGSNSITSNGTYTYTAMYEDSSGNDQSTGATRTVTVNVSSGDPTAYYNAGYNQALADCGVSGGGTVYTGSWYAGTLYAAPQQGSQTYTNCVVNATGHRVYAK